MKTKQDRCLQCLHILLEVISRIFTDWIEDICQFKPAFEIFEPFSKGLFNSSNNIQSYVGKTKFHSNWEK